MAATATPAPAAPAEVPPGQGQPQLSARQKRRLAAAAAAAADAQAIVKKELNNHQIVCIDIEEEERPAQAKQGVKREGVKREGVKREGIKREMKLEPREEKRKEKKAKVKKEKPEDRERSRSKHKEKDKKQHEDGRRRRSRSKSRKRRSRSGSSSSDSDDSSSSQSAMYRRLKPYTKVQLVNLVRKADLNGMSGQVVHPSCAVSPCPPGCMLVRLETGREIAVKPHNLIPLQSFHVGLQQAPAATEARLHQVLRAIKLNVDGSVDRSADLSIIDSGSGNVPRGGIGHML